MVNNDVKEQRTFSPINLRLRLVRRICYRLWKFFAIRKAKQLIHKVHYESQSNQLLFTPAIILSTFSRIEDLFILSYLFKGEDLTFLSPMDLQSDRLINRLLSVNFVLRFNEKQIGFSFFRSILSLLRDFNRSIVISPAAAGIYAKNVSVDPAVIVKMAMKANVPIVPVVLKWYPESDVEKSRFLEVKKKCDVYIGDKLYASPRNPIFKDIFFRRRGFRKFEKLSKDELREIGDRIFLKLETLGEGNGSDLSKILATRFC